MRLRSATLDDAMMLFEWANDPLTREMSFESDPIPLETHIKWLNNILPRGVLFIAEIDGEPVGQVRVTDGEVGITVAPMHRGKRYGAQILNCLSGELTAHIKHKNISSIKAFEAGGFKLIGESEIKGHKCLEYKKAQLSQ